jgi:hypothetical protein
MESKSERNHKRNLCAPEKNGIDSALSAAADQSRTQPCYTEPRCQSGMRRAKFERRLRKPYLMRAMPKSSASRYEWMFWDMVWRGERLPIEGSGPRR